MVCIYFSMKFPPSEWYALHSDLSGLTLEQSKENPWYIIEKKPYAFTQSLFNSEIKIHYEYKPVQQKGRNLLTRKSWCFVKAIETQQWYSHLTFCIRDPKREIRWISFLEIEAWSSFPNNRNCPRPIYLIAVFADFLRIVSQLNNWDDYDKVSGIEAHKERLKNSAEPLASILLSNKSSYAYQDPPSESETISIARLAYAQLVKLKSAIMEEANNEALLNETQEKLSELEHLIKTMGLKL